MRILPQQIWRTAAIGLCFLLTAACTTGEPEGECPDIPLHTGECVSEEQGKKSKTPRWRDEKDGGDAPFEAGCHYGFTPNTNCTQGKFFIQGDICLSGQLREWTDKTCHRVHADHKMYDCDKECRAQGNAGGSCVVKKDFCGNGNDSAICECVIVQP